MSLNILIVWKDDKFYKHLLSILEYKKHSVIDSSSEKKAITLLQKHNIDVIFYEHDEHDYFEFINIVRYIIPQSIPIIIYSNIDSARIAMKAILSGANDYFVKATLHPKELEEKIKNLICESEKIIKLNKDLKKYKKQALLDSLTKLTNRRGVEDFLRKNLAFAKRHECPLACFYMDLDDFKEINDRYGHEYGDLVLKKVGSRINTILREENMIARYGGDEFLIIILGLNNMTNAAIIANKILKTLQLPIESKKGDLYINASIGISFSHSEMTSDTLISEAEEAMRNSKMEGKGLFTFYNMLLD